MSPESQRWAELVIVGARTALTAAADPVRAPAMRAYMKDVAPYLGVTAPARRAVLRPIWKAVGRAPTAEALGCAAAALWALDEREFVYAAIDLLAFSRRVLDEASLVEIVEPLVISKSWWDSVDGLQGAAVGPLVRRYPDLVAVIERWAASDNRWLIRSAIIHQLGFGADTEVELLFALCRQHAHQPEFFIAKAIGWALRDYSYVDPAAIEHFVAATPLRLLSKREALKAIERRR
jgi:3-methyladenine DNA glycosylase AlkD